MKTPAPQRAAGRKKLAAAGQALPSGAFPIPDLDYLKRAIRSIGRVDPAKRPAVKALILKRARELKATNAPGVKGTWPFQGASDTEAIEMAASTRMPVIRGAADVQASRTAPGTVSVMHASTGMKVGTVTAVPGGYQPVHASGKTLPASPTMGHAMAGLIAWHNKMAAAKAATAAAVPAPAGSVKAFAAGEQQELDLAGAIPVTSSGDGPRITSASGGKKGKSVAPAKLTMAAQGAGPAVSAAASKLGLSPEGATLYAKFIRKGMKPAVALAFAKRASAMHAKKQAKAA